MGPLIVDDPEDPYLNDYDAELIVILQDWFHVRGVITGTMVIWSNRFCRCSSGR